MENKDGIQYEIDADDLIAFYAYNQEYNPKVKHLRRRLFIISIVCALSLIIVAIVTIIFTNVGVIFGIILGFLGVYCLVIAIFVGTTLGYKIFKRSLIKQYQKKYSMPNRITGKHKLSISSDGIVDVNDVGQNTTNWNGIGWVASNGKYLVLTGADNSIVNIVPSRAFSNEISFNQFVETAKSYYEKNSKKSQN